MRKGDSLRKYVYKPYHSWRHGHRREKIQAWMVLVLKVALAVELLILSGRYIEGNTSTRFFEREEAAGYGSSEDVYGIGFEAGKGEVFWFHRKTEAVDKIDESQ